MKVSRNKLTLLYTHIKFLVVIIIVSLSLIDINKYYRLFNNEQWRNAAYHIEENAEMGRILLFNAYYCQIPFEYYSNRADLIKKPFPKITRDVDGKI